MARMKLKQLRDPEVRYISLVDRSATRIPFRVLKWDKESKMLDLTKVFKSDASVKPFISTVVVFAQKSDEARTQIQEAIAAHGFKTDRTQKSDEGETLAYAQCDQPTDTMLVRLSDQSLVVVAGMPPIEGWMGALVKEHGFVPDLALATEALQDELNVVLKSEKPEDAQQVFDGYAEYLNTMLALPSACYKMDEAINVIVQKCGCGDEKKVEAAKEEETEAVKDEEKPAETSYKADLSGLEERLTALFGTLTQKVDGVVTEQTAQKKTLDEVAAKAETLESTLKTTVTAPSTSEDLPRIPRMRVDKKDDDPRTGTFDTAFIRKSSRR